MSEQATPAVTDSPVAPPAADRPDSPRQLRIHEKQASFRARKEKTPRVPDMPLGPVASEKLSLRSLDAMIEEELKAAMSAVAEDELMPRDTPVAKGDADKPKLGGWKSGTVVAVNGGDVFVEMPGNRSQGMIPGTQFPEGLPAVGDVLEFAIARYDSNMGILLFTRAGAVAEANWSTVAIGQTVEAKVLDVNRGGLSVEVNGIRGFLPISQIELYRVEKPEEYLGKKIVCMVAEVDVASKNLVVSRKALLEREREENAKKLWEELAEGQVRKGFVRLVKPFGAFVDLGGVDGLIPISEMSWKRIKDPSEVLAAGDNVEVVITRLNREERRVSLSLRQLQVSPWDTAHLSYPETSVHPGIVTKLMEFGAFVELEPGVEGLVHISELATGRVNRVGDVCKEGDSVQVRVLKLDRDARRISLTIKGVKEAEKVDVPVVNADGSPVPENAADAAKPAKPRPSNLKGGLGVGRTLFPSLGAK